MYLSGAFILQHTKRFLPSYTVKRSILLPVMHISGVDCTRFIAQMAAQPTRNRYGKFYSCSKSEKNEIIYKNGKYMIKNVGKTVFKSLPALIILIVGF